MSLLLSPISTIWRNWAPPIVSWGQRPLIHPPGQMEHQIPWLVLSNIQSSQTFYNLIADQPGTASPGSRDHPHHPAFSHPTPGMLSAALQGNLPPASHQPPTPPRTPQGNKFDAEARGGGPGAGLMPKMPSLFALQGLQHQMLSGGGAGAKGPASLHQPLTSQLNKQGLQGKQILHLPTLICPNLQKKDF